MIAPLLLSMLTHATSSTIGVATAPTPPPAERGALLGVEIEDVPPAYPHRYQTTGAYVLRVAPDSPAESARILPGDVIVTVHGTAVTDHVSFRTATATLTAGSAVDIGIRRYGKALTRNATPVAGNVLYPKAPSCEPDQLANEFGAAAVSARRRDFDNERVHGAKALDLAETCVSLEQANSGATMLSVADAFAVIGTAAADQSDRDAANGLLADAWVVDRYVAAEPETTAEQRRVATMKAASLERRVPSIGSYGDNGVARGLAYSGTGLGANPFSVVNVWNTSGDNYTRLLHVRIKIDADRDALLFANFFRVSVSSSDGPEVYFAIDSASHPGPRISYPGRGAKAEVAPEEDLGYMVHAYVVAHQPATYVLTFVIGDKDADLTNTPSTLAYLPQWDRIRFGHIHALAGPSSPLPLSPYCRQSLSLGARFRSIRTPTTAIGRTRFRQST